MSRIHLLGFALIMTMIGSACSGLKKGMKDDGKIEVNLLQINDVYEISPLENGKSGGMARVGAIKKRFEKQGPTLLLHAGDFLSPSVMGTLDFDGKERIKGRHMIDLMNVIGVDLVTFGNHEFDLKEKELMARLNESTSTWISANVYHVVDKTNMAFEQNGKPLPAYTIKTLTDQDGTSLRIGFLGITLPYTKQPYVAYTDANTAARDAYTRLKDSVDLVIGITHQSIDEDKITASILPEVPLWIGGHEHNNMLVPVGKSHIAKADANAKTVYRHELEYNKKTKKFEIESELITVNDQITPDPEAQKSVEKWEQFAEEQFKKMGFNPKETVVKLREPLDGREAVIRTGPSKMGDVCAKAASFAAPGTDFSIFHTGSIRVDDVISGVINQYDIFRILPFGGKIVEVEIKGKLIELAIKMGVTENIGKGGYLALDRVSFDPKLGKAIYQGAPLDPDKYYRVAMPDYLMTGKEVNLGFLTKDNASIRNVLETTEPSDPRTDVRNVLIKYLKEQY